MFKTFSLLFPSQFQASDINEVGIFTTPTAKKEKTNKNHPEILQQHIHWSDM